MPNNKITYRSIKDNSKLTEFGELKDTVVKNTFRGAPKELKNKSNDKDKALNFFC